MALMVDYGPPSLPLEVRLASSLQPQGLFEQLAYATRVCMNLHQTAISLICLTLGRGVASGSQAEKLVRSEKTCVSEGESPSSLEARLPEFGTKVKNGKV
jgi:hypothetical protein